MEKIIEQAKKELKEIEEKGLNAGNLELVSKLAEVTKNLYKIQKLEKEEDGQEMDYGRYRDGYRARGGNYRDGDYAYRDGGYSGYFEGEYGRRGVPGSGRGRYRDSRMREHMNKMMEGMDEYEYGRDRYMHGDDNSRALEGLEMLMYGVCMFVESAKDFAETPEEKEVIRKHLQKLSHV